MISENSNIDNLREPIIEIKEEDINNENNDTDNLNDPQVEMKEELINCKNSASQSCKVCTKKDTLINSPVKVHLENCLYYCSQKGTLKNHVGTHIMKQIFRTHTRRWKYKCNQCNKEFLSNRNLLDHIRFHTGERLMNHVKTHGGGRSYKCSNCDK
ncbi:unnamed protein product, partial [Meganyctiphanes norvegica]